MKNIQLLFTVLSLLLPGNKISMARSWDKDPDQYIKVDMARRYFNRDKIFGEYKPFKTRFLKKLPGYKKKKTPLNSFQSRNNKKTDAKGFFYVKKISSRWWLVDPLGNLFFSIGINSIQPHITKKQRKPAVKIFKSRWNSTREWAEETSSLLKEYGFNTIGTWSDEYYQKLKKRIVWTKIIGFVDSHNPCIPVFDPGFEEKCYKRAEKSIEKKWVNDPYLLGYFSDNELPWKDNMLEQYLNLDKNDINYQKALEWFLKLKGIKHKPISIDQVRKMISSEDKEQFIGYIAEKYYSTVSKALKKADPNHLYLGSRLHGSALKLKPVFKALGKYADIISINYYHRWTPQKSDFRNWDKWSSSKPYYISEWYIKSEDSGRENNDGAGAKVKTQLDRGRFYQNFTLGLLETGSCVGWSWHNYRDRDPMPMGSNKGIFNFEYELFQPLADMAKEVNTEVYSIIDYFDD